MATRIYLPSPGYSPAPISPAFDAGWETTDTAGRRRCSTIKGASPMATSTVNMKNVVDADTLVTQYVFGPLKAQTISGTIKGQIQGRHDSGLLDTRAQLLVKVVSADGGTVRGTLLPMDTGALSSEFVAVLRNRMFPRGGAQALTNVAAQKGDWIVLEVGVRQHGTYTLHTASLRYGEAAANDLAEDESDADDDAPWFEFSMDIALHAGGAAMLMAGV